ncbi:MAG: MgtC/SapB family protein [Syntrophobacteraceae bacterium]
MSLEILGKLTLATILGGSIGFERESHGQAAGLRTNIMVCVGACLLMMLSLFMEEIFENHGVRSVVRLDPGRIASYAVASMGFMGAGAIIKGKGTVRGLTTAAGLWMVTGSGLAVGAGFYMPAVLTTVISLLILYNMRFLKLFFSHDVFSSLTLTFPNTVRALKRIRATLGEFENVEIRFVNYRQDIVKGTVTYELRLCTKDDILWGKIVGRLLEEFPDLLDLAWEESDVP